MITRRALGGTELVVSSIGLGGNNFGTRLDYADTERVVHAAVGAGINLIDTAEIYGDGQSEEFLGRALKDQRNDIVLATKFGRPPSDGRLRSHGSAEYVRAALEQSLRRLQTDRIDIYQMHFPDPLIPIEETLGALASLISEGKVRSIGTCNFASWQLAHAECVSRTLSLGEPRPRFVCTQNDYSLLDRGPELELLPACRFYGIGFICYQPLGQGLLTGKYRAGRPAPTGSRLAELPDALHIADFSGIEALERFAAARGLGLPHVALGYLLAQPAVTSMIVGATNPKQVEMNASVEWIPTDGDLKEIRSLLGPIKTMTWPNDPVLFRRRSA